MQKKADIVLTIMALIAGTSFLVTKWGVAELSPLSFLFWRFSLALLAYMLIWPLLKSQGAAKSSLKKGLLLGVFLVGGVIALAYFLKWGQSVKGAFLVYSGALWVPLFAKLLGGKPMNKTQILSFVLGVGGVFLLVFQKGMTVQWIDLLGFGGALIFAWYTVLNSKYSPDVNVKYSVLGQLLTSLVCVGLLGVFTNDLSLSLTPNTFWIVLYMGIIATGIRYGAQSWAQGYASASHTVVIFTLEPLSAALWGVMLAGEILSLNAWVGVFAIFSAQIIAKWDLWKN